MDKVVMQGQLVRGDDFIRNPPKPLGLRICRQVFQNDSLEAGKVFNRFGQESVRPGGSRELRAVVIAAGPKDDTYARRPPGQFADQVFAGPIGKTKIDNHDRRSVNGKVPARRGQIVGAPDPGAGSQAKQSHRFGRISAVFNHEHGQPQKRTIRRGRLTKREAVRKFGHGRASLVG